jgi:hypothetical protein
VGLLSSKSKAAFMMEKNADLLNIKAARIPKSNT